VKPIYTVDVHVKGIRPLLQNHGQEEENGAAKKGAVYDDVEETEKRLIKDDKGSICQLATHFEGCLIKSGTEFKFKGQKTYKDIIKAGVLVDPYYIPHLIPEYRIHKAFVRIGKSRIMRCRPEFPEWELQFNVEVTDDRLQAPVLKQIFENAGAYYGVGDWRPRFGLFDVIGWEVRNGNS